MKKSGYKRVIQKYWLYHKILVFFFVSVIFSIFLGDMFYGLAIASAFTMILIVNKVYNEGYYIEYDLKDLE
jgi:hypothetical protein